ncbi:MAG: DnaJ domain-containing protein [Armatimonadetes bacterium]|nr:DnaJ domain-containing protein [Armatimonadota bacterium]
MRGFLTSEWDRIRRIESELFGTPQEAPWAAEQQAETPTATPPAAPLSKEDANTTARKLLGVTETATYDEIRDAFKRLNERSDPDKFPEGSKERENAAQIQKRIQWAYSLLSAPFDSSEKRFKSLEI